jgi:glycosyltransferase involved in cell wall biosynthesis
MIEEIVVSVCMITYNQEKYISQAIISALNQNASFKYEIVIGEDCSTDNTRNILLSFKEQFPDKINLILNDVNIGAVKNLAQTIKACKGRYIAILEGDDYWTCVDKIQIQADFLSKNLNYSTCFHATQLVDVSGSIKTVLPIEKFRKPTSKLIDLIEHDSFMATCSIMFRARLYEYFPDIFFVLRNGCDWTLNILNSQYGDIGYIDKIMSVYRTASSEFAWTSNPLSYIYLDAIKINEAFNEYFDFKYKLIFDKKIINYYHIISIDYFRHGMIIEGFKALSVSYSKGLSPFILLVTLFLTFPYTFLKGKIKSLMNYFRLIN